MAYTQLLLSLIWLTILSVILHAINTVQPEPYMDEIFHVPQARAYCHGNYSHWDPMITTPPGLYATSLFAVKTMESVLQLTGLCCQLEASNHELCSTAFLRYHNVLLWVVNFWIVHKILQIQHAQKVERDGDLNKNGEDSSFVSSVSLRGHHLLLLSLTLLTFPVLFFFSFLYYTDMGAVCFVLLGYWLSLVDRHRTSAVVFTISVLYRQTNIVWAAFAAGTVFLRHVDKFSKSSSKDSTPVLKLVWDLGPYALVAVGFTVFVYINSGIVMGDKSHHEATLHLPQFLYFFSILTFFSLPQILIPLRDFVKFLRTLLLPMNLLSTLLLTAVSLFAVHYFTYEHSYLLADNRHYPFYVWKNLFRKYQYARYFLTPVYSVIILYWIRNLTQKQSYLWVVGLLACIVLATVPQKLLEFRYFVLPYLFVKIHCQVQSSFALYLEFFTNSLVNFLTIFLFLSSPFKWPNSDQWQRFMW